MKPVAVPQPSGSIPPQSGLPSEDSKPRHSFEWIDYARIAVVSIAALTAWVGAGSKSACFDLLAMGAAVIGGYPVWEEAISNLLARRMTMELSMSIALVAAFAIREAFTGLIILLFVLVAEMLEEMTVDRGRRAIQTLLELLPKRATVRREGQLVALSIQQIEPGDIVVVKPGEEIAVDGSVVRGHSFVDQASITGESTPAEKIAGGNVFAGTTNLSGSLDISASRIGRDTVLGKIVEAVEQAEQSRAPVQKTADRLAGYLVVGSRNSNRMSRSKMDRNEKHQMGAPSGIRNGFGEPGAPAAE